MNHLRSSKWKKSGFSLLWDVSALTQVVLPSGVVSLRGFFSLSQQWPETLPGSDGDALVVVGVEGCLDVLSNVDGKRWLEEDLKPMILSFQSHYQGQAALIIWLPSGKSRVLVRGFNEECFWKSKASVSSSSQNKELPLGRCLWGGLGSEVLKIHLSGAKDGDYVGLYHSRIA